MSSDSSTLAVWSGPFSVKGVTGKFLLRCFTEIPVLSASDLDYTTLFADVLFMGRQA